MAMGGEHGYTSVAEHEDDLPVVNSRKRMRIVSVLAAAGAMAAFANQTSTTSATSTLSWPWTDASKSAPPNHVMGELAASDWNNHRDGNSDARNQGKNSGKSNGKSSEKRQANSGKSTGGDDRDGADKDSNGSKSKSSTSTTSLTNKGKRCVKCDTIKPSTSSPPLQVTPHPPHHHHYAQFEAGEGCTVLGFTLPAKLGHSDGEGGRACQA